jgi:hypothetical protein
MNSFILSVVSFTLVSSSAVGFGAMGSSPQPEMSTITPIVAARKKKLVAVKKTVFCRIMEPSEYGKKPKKMAFFGSG